MSVKRITLVVLSMIVLLGFVGYGLHDAVRTKDKLDFQDVQLKSRSTEIKDLNLRYEKLDLELEKASQEKNINQEQLDKLNDEKQELEKQKQELEAQLQAKLEEKNRIALAATRVANAATATATANATALDSGINCSNQTTAKAFIYCHESGNNPANTNPGGCRGLGQACPGSKLPCTDHDYACQDAYFTKYMQDRYGSWEAAKTHWIARVPINGKDVGNWW